MILWAARNVWCIDVRKTWHLKCSEAAMERGCYFPSGSDGHLALSYAISRLGPRAAASICVRRHGGYMGGVEAKTAVEDLSAKSFPRYG